MKSRQPSAVSPQPEERPNSRTAEPPNARPISSPDPRPPTPGPRPVGIVGVGLLGEAVVRRLVATGHEVVGYDVVPERARLVEELGGKGAASAREVSAKAGAVFTILPTPASVDQVVGELINAGRAETTILQMSTISPDQARRLGEQAAARGIRFLDAPISGTSSMVTRGDCVFTVGGDAGALERVRPVLEAIAKRVFHVGPSGMGSHLKLVTNLIMGLNGVALAEGLALARKAGLDIGQTLEILRHGAAGSKILEVRGPLMASGTYSPLMKVDLFLKDIRLMLESAQALHVPVPLTAVMQQLYTAAAARGRGLEDLAAIAALYEELGGLKDR